MYSLIILGLKSKFELKFHYGQLLKFQTIQSFLNWLVFF